MAKEVNEEKQGIEVKIEEALRSRIQHFKENADGCFGDMGEGKGIGTGKKHHKSIGNFVVVGSIGNFLFSDYRGAVPGP
ncbi:hypothetical protein MTR67_047533 [Solanum verrucosum]|uniref:Uncharacterized protein n=1 Tax=Solanum verrucosum TaxID=315347 RepID=A0AAF0UZM1_SOLVR|nr:hypothetical protein MTR67_047533 [Solanum verrucosum]